MPYVPIDNKAFARTVIESMCDVDGRALDHALGHYNPTPQNRIDCVMQLRELWVVGPDGVVRDPSTGDWLVRI